MSRVLKQRKAWASVVTCHKCGRSEEFYHGKMTKKEAIADWPSFSLNGWLVAKKKETCPICRFGIKVS